MVVSLLSEFFYIIQISATAGISRITEEHLALLVALDLPFFAVITKCDIAGSLQPLLQQLTNILAQDNKVPILYNRQYHILLLI
jgi:GTPase